jgi:AcrR family transcriptional regulator
MPAPSKRERTRRHIAMTAHALFERHGFEAVTMEQIAAEAGIVRGTLYNHFPVKEAVLVEWMHAQLAEDLVPLMADVMARPSFAARVATVLDSSAQWWERHRQYAAPYVRFRFQQVRDADQGSTASDMTTTYALLLDHAQQNGEVRDDEPAQRLASYLHFLYLHALLAWIGDEDLSLADELAHAFEFFMQGAARR